MAEVTVYVCISLIINGKKRYISCDNITCLFTLLIQLHSCATNAHSGKTSAVFSKVMPTNHTKTETERVRFSARTWRFTEVSVKRADWTSRQEDLFFSQSSFCLSAETQCSFIKPEMQMTKTHTERKALCVLLICTSLTLVLVEINWRHP